MRHGYPSESACRAASLRAPLYDDRYGLMLCNPSKRPLTFGRALAAAECLQATQVLPSVREEGFVAGDHGEVNFDSVCCAICLQGSVLRLS